MNFSDLRITITDTFECPYCQRGDEFEFTDRAMVIERGSTLCMTFMADLVKSLPTVLVDSALSTEFECSGNQTGCPGRMNYRVEKFHGANRAGNTLMAKNFEAISKLLLNLPLFASFDQRSIRRLLNHFKLKSCHDLKFKPFRTGETILQKGQPGTHLYIIIAGTVAVVDEAENYITTLGRGDVFGEMSMISGKPVGATVRASSSTTVLRLPGKELNDVLPYYPTLQSYFTRLLAQRLTNTNVDRTMDLSSGMTGKLSEIPPEELLQTLNFNRKTGVLDLQLPGGAGEIRFMAGEILYAEYGSLRGQSAITAIVKNRGGKFRFNPGLSADTEGMPEIGNFMGMLMDALKEMDEDESSKTQ